jgi:hypothetical protein
MPPSLLMPSKAARPGKQMRNKRMEKWKNWRRKKGLIPKLLLSALNSTAVPPPALGAVDAQSPYLQVLQFTISHLQSTTNPEKKKEE